MPPKVFVRSHSRRQVAARRPAHPSRKRLASERQRDAAYGARRPALADVIEDVRSGRRSGYTWTYGYFFDIDDPESMEVLYDRIGGSAIYAIATTNRTLAEFEARGGARALDLGHNFGVGLWRHADGTVYADRVVVHAGIDDEEAMAIAREHGQFNFLKVDGRIRQFAFLETPGYDVTIHGEGTARTFEGELE